MSDKPMTQEELDTIRTIMGQTTPGNWYAYEDKAGDEFGIKSFDGGKKVVPIRNHSNQWDYGSEGIPRKEDAIFIAMSKEIVGCLMAEVERLRGEVEMLNKAVNGWQDEYESAQRCADIATQQVLLLAKKLFDNHICHKAVLCKQGNINGRKFEGEDGCGFCWEEWAWHLAAYEIEDAARKSVEEKNG